MIIKIISIFYTFSIKLLSKLFFNTKRKLKPVFLKNKLFVYLHKNLYKPEIFRFINSLDFFFYIRFSISSYKDYIFKKKICTSSNIENPLVSIVIPIYKKRFNLYRCLKSLNKFKPNLSYEVIVIDDFPNGKKPFYINDQIKYIKNKDNIGFVKSCNKGAQIAKGDFIYFLNDDTILLNKTISKLYERICSDSRIGIVGSKVLYPNSLIQEAGCITFSDGNCYQIGNLENKLMDDYNFVKEVDYVSGCSLFIRAKLFNEIKFDELYSPGYYEDVDLAFSVKRKNFKVVYEPNSEVIHCEGSSAGTNLNMGMKQFQIINKNKFFLKWQNELQKKSKSDEIDKLKLTFLEKKIIIIIDDLIPDMRRDAGSLIPLFLIKYYKEKNYDVCFFSRYLDFKDPNIAELQDQGVRVIYFEKSLINILNVIKKKILATVILRPYNLKRYHNTIHDLNIKIIYHYVDLHFLRIERENKTNSEINSEVHVDVNEIKEIELNLVKKNFLNISCSKFESQILADEYKIENIIHLPLFYPNSNYERINKTKKNKELNLVFLGSSNHLPNYDAVINFAKNILPLLNKKILTNFHVIGSGPKKIEILKLNKQVIIHGKVDNLSSVFNKIDIAVSPLRYGAGTKGKIISYAMHYLPIICSKTSIEGTSFVHDHDLIVSDPDCYQDYADDIYNLFNNEKLMLKLSKNINSKFLNEYTFEKGIKDLNYLDDYKKLRFEN